MLTLAVRRARGKHCQSATAAEQPVAGDVGRVGRWWCGALGVRPPRLNRGVSWTTFMVDVGLSKREIRERSSQLNDLLCEWDPIGVMSVGAPRDEYDCLIGPLLTLLQSGGTATDIQSYLRKEIVEHFGVSSEPYDFLAV